MEEDEAPPREHEGGQKSVTRVLFILDVSACMLVRVSLLDRHGGPGSGIESRRSVSYILCSLPAFKCGADNSTVKFGAMGTKVLGCRRGLCCLPNILSDVKPSAN